MHIKGIQGLLGADPLATCPHHFRRNKPNTLPAPQKSHINPTAPAPPLRLVSHFPSASLGSNTDHKNRVGRSSFSTFLHNPILLAETRLSAPCQYAEEQGKRWQEPPQRKERERVRCDPFRLHSSRPDVANTRPSNEKRELTFKEEGQEYAQVLKMLGNGRLEAMVRPWPP